MSITGLAVEALPADTGSASFGDVRARMDTLLGELNAVTLAGVADPLDAAGWARALESRVSAFRLAALAEAERAGAARKVGAFGTAAWPARRLIRIMGGRGSGWRRGGSNPPRR